MRYIMLIFGLMMLSSITIVRALDICTEQQIDTNQMCYITTFVWNRTTNAFVNNGNIEINISYENGSKEVSTLMNFRSGGHYNYTYPGSPFPGPRFCVITAAGNTPQDPVDCSFMVNRSLISEIQQVPPAVWNFQNRTLTQTLFQPTFNGTINITNIVTVNATFNVTANFTTTDLANVVNQTFFGFCPQGTIGRCVYEYFWLARALPMNWNIL